MTQERAERLARRIQRLFDYHKIEGHCTIHPANDGTSHVAVHSYLGDTELRSENQWRFMQAKYVADAYLAQATV